MATYRVSRVLGGTILALGMAVASCGYATPHAVPGTSQNGAYLGVMVDKVSPEMAAAQHVASGSTMIANVDQDGPACHAGLKGGDIVTAFNGKQVSGPEQFADLIHDSAPGSTVTLTVVRNGHSQDMKVKLGDWKQMAAMPPPPPPPQPLSPAGTMPRMNAMPAMPAFDVPGYSPLLAHSGILVEPLSPQLCDFFGVPQNQGVLVRSVDKGSPGANAGLKAGDVIVRVNDETIHDMQDWKRALKKQGGKLMLSIVRDKRPQTLQMTVPANTSELNGPEWQRFEPDMQAFSAEMEKVRPEFASNAQEMAQWDPQQWESVRKQIEESMKAVEPEMKRQAEEMSKQAAQMKVQSEELRKEMEKMTPELQRQAKEMAESMKPSARELADMNREIQKTLKDIQPQLQKQMEEFQKEWQQEMREWQKAFQEGKPKRM